MAMATTASTSTTRSPDLGELLQTSDDRSGRGTGRPLSGIGRTAGTGSLPPPELALMRAVLQDAVLCYLGRAKRRRIDPRILAREAEHWIRINDWDSPFSFNNVCEALGLNHQSTRNTILAWSETNGGGNVARLAELG